MNRICCFLLLMNILTFETWYFILEVQVDRTEVEEINLEEFGNMARLKKKRFYIHLNADSEEFNQPTTTIHLYLGSPNVSSHPSSSHAPPQSPLQPHPNIHELII